jgi:transposase
MPVADGRARLHPGSQISHWSNERFAGTGKRMRRIEIVVALARRLEIALWRYLKHGAIPVGPILKPRDVNTVRARTTE